MDNMTDRKVETPPDGLNIDGYIFFFLPFREHDRCWKVARMLPNMTNILVDKSLTTPLQYQPK